VLLPKDLQPDHVTGRTVVVFDVLRATTTMTAALAAGVEGIRIYPDTASARRRWFRRGRSRPLLMGGVSERHPALKFVMTEQGCAWIPPVLQGLDAFHSQMSSGRIGEINYSEDQVLPMKPSEYFARNCYVGVSFPSPGEAKAMRKVGLDRVMWGSDYPHDESTYPYTTEGLRLAFAAWDPDDVRQVTSGTASDVYEFDLDV